MRSATRGFWLAPLLALITVAPFGAFYMLSVSTSGVKDPGVAATLYIGMVTLIALYLHTLLFAVPLFLVVRKFLSITRATCMLGGLAVGAAPVFTLIATLCAEDAAGFCVNGYNLDMVALFGAYGLCAGYYFWRLVRPLPQAEIR